jgi:hypothetical protein
MKVQLINYPVIVSYCNNGYYDFAKNMFLNLNKVLKFHKVHFYCLDIEIYEKLCKLNLSNINVKFELFNTATISKDFEQYGTKNYNMITHTKMDVLRAALKQYNFIHFIDCDVVCCKEPSIDHYIKYIDYDVVFQYDCGMLSAEELHHPQYHIWCCTGNTTLRNTESTHALLNKISEYQTKYDNNDQESLYHYFKDISITDIRDYKDAKLFTYELKEYTNGYWLDHDIGTLDNTYFFHANHVIGKEKKLRLLKKANQYYLE